MSQTTPKIAVVGTGYVGLVTGSYFANHGFAVTCIDISAERVTALKAGHMPFFEPGLDTYVKRAVDLGQLEFATDYPSSLKDAAIVFICVGTPPKNGDADMSFVEAALTSVTKNLDHNAVIVGKSTMPFGIKAWILEIIAKNKKADITIEWVVNPEFLSEGTALADMESPSRVVIGGDSETAVDMVSDLYKDVSCPIIKTDVESAALIKYASNSFLATKISFVNSLANVADKLDADVDHILQGMGLDPRIGSRYLKAGVGFGGSCLPKDIQAFYTTAEKHDSEFGLLKEVERINLSQPQKIVNKVKKHLKDLAGKRVALLGLAFKPDTDDIREAPSLKLIPILRDAGASVVAYDPQAAANVRKLQLPIEIADSASMAFEQADAVILATEWPLFRDLNWADLKNRLKQPIVIDGRNFLDKEKLKNFGFTYEGVGTR